MKEQKHIMSLIRRAADDYAMIDGGDRIAVGVSGGKDSLTLLWGMATLRRFYPKPFDLVAISVDLGFEGSDLSPIAAFSEELGVPFHPVRTEISKIIFDTRRESNPCSLCANMRRGALHKTAAALGCNKVALGHHFDDAVETFMMNLFFEGRLGCFSPVTYLSEKNIKVIRPLVYAEERDIAYFARRTALPVLPSLCPEDHATERENMKKFLSSLEREKKGLKHRIFHAMCKARIDGFYISEEENK